MHQYSPFFQTLYDQPEPIGDLGRGAHYSVLRCLHADTNAYQDFAVIWDADHDERVIHLIEDMHGEGCLDGVLFIGERKGMVSVIVEDRYTKASREILESSISTADDPWTLDVTTAVDPNYRTSIIDDSKVRVRTYLNAIDVLWFLGLKPRPSKLIGERDAAPRKARPGSINDEPQLNTADWIAALDKLKVRVGEIVAVPSDVVDIAIAYLGGLFFENVVDLAQARGFGATIIIPDSATRVRRVADHVLSQRPDGSIVVIKSRREQP